MNNQYESWTTPQRQAIAGIFIFVYKTAIIVIKGAWPILVLLFLRGKSEGRNTYLWILIGFTLFVLVRSILTFIFFRFYIHDNDLIIKSGFIKRKTLSIPLTSIHAVNIEQSLLHQILKISKIKIDTAGSERMEAEIDAISVRQAEAFKDFLLQQVPVHPDNTVNLSHAIQRPLIKLSGSDLVKLGLSSNHIQTFFIILAFTISFIQNLEEIFGDEVINYLKQSTAWISVRMLFFVVIAVLILSVFVSVARISIAYFNFELAETYQGFRIRTGLLNTKQYLVPYKKIQLFTWKSNWLRRKIGLYTLQFQQASTEAVGKNQRIKVPIAQEPYIHKLLAHYHPDIRDNAASVHHIHRVYAFRRMVMPGVPVSILLILLFYPWLSYGALYFSLYLFVQYLNSYFFRRNFRLYVAETALQVKKGVWGREIRLMRWNKLQHIEMKQSIYQKSRNLATLILFSAGGSIKIPFIPLSLAYQIYNYALYKTESTNETWM